MFNSASQRTSLARSYLSSHYGDSDEDQRVCSDSDSYQHGDSKTNAGNGGLSKLVNESSATLGSLVTRLFYNASEA